MRFFGLALVLVVLSTAFSAPSHAKKWEWWPKNWQTMNFQPYIGEQKLNQRTLWDKDTWTPEAWVKDAGDSRRILRDFYAVGIVTSQYNDGNNIPVLEVGDAFIQLSGLDRRRVLEFIDYVFEITESEENGMFYVYYEKDDEEPLGLYNKHGFQSY